MSEYGLKMLLESLIYTNLKNLDISGFFSQYVLFGLNFLKNLICNLGNSIGNRGAEYLAKYITVSKKFLIFFFVNFSK